MANSSKVEINLDPTTLQLLKELGALVRTHQERIQDLEIAVTLLTSQLFAKGKP